MKRISKKIAAYSTRKELVNELSKGLKIKNSVASELIDAISSTVFTNHFAEDRKSYAKKFGLTVDQVKQAQAMLWANLGNAVRIFQAAAKNRSIYEFGHEAG